MQQSGLSLPKPSLSRGEYPEQTDPVKPGLEQWIKQLTNQLHQYWKDITRADQTLLDQIEQASNFWSALDQTQWPEHIRQLRLDLIEQGLQTPLICRSFALIREIAEQTLGKRHYPSQLIGGLSLLNGQVAEMETGEGKTLTATLAAATAALAGVPVHVITVNDYLAQRDATLMQPLYQKLGLTVGVIQEAMDAEQRRAAYACSITYCSNKQVAFDYLKDRIVLGRSSHKAYRLSRLGQPQEPPSLIMRGLCYAIIDEADSVLIDEAKTPLILSKEVKDTGHLQDLHDALRLARLLNANRDFLIRTKTGSIQITEPGQRMLHQLTVKMEGLWQGEKRREAMVQLALKALYCFERDKHYLVKDDTIQIIDEFTGRAMPDRSWEKLLHQMIQIKENCEVTGHLETLARIAYQKFFSRYLKLSGMTGTAKEVSRELAVVYGLTMAVIPSHKPSRRNYYPSCFYVTEQAKWQAVIQRIRLMQQQARPVLIGTRTVAASEYLSHLLKQQGIVHQLLNARQDQQEADLIARAGQPGQITIATNMAGRGTDILIDPAVVELGGLHVIATERHDSRRIDRQLFGRCARQGDPGSVEELLSLEDDLLQKHGSKLLLHIANQFSNQDQTLPTWLGHLLFFLSQRAAERYYAAIRKKVKENDQKTSSLLGFTGRSD